jgi:coenzyme PQQ precursor peptide PqqA
LGDGFLQADPILVFRALSPPRAPLARLEPGRDSTHYAIRPDCIRRSGPSTREEQQMWTKPKVVEIAVGMEINAYACADLD